jgi:nitrogen fixation/metabolism regulation signal transduction histidine kinase
LLGLSHFSHINQLHNVNETYPALFHQLKAGDRIQISLMNEREELPISLRVTEIRLKRGMMRILTLNNIDSELESKEMESWIRLIRVMTHEIMNSIAPITSLSETMRFLYRSDTDSNELRQNTLEAFETIYTTASGLLSFVESYRKFTAVPKPEKRSFVVNTLVDKVVKLYEPALAEKNISLEAHLPESLVAYADENLIAQVLINLIKNAIEAIEANDNGKIIISGERNADDRIDLEVADSGKPIPADVLPHIFIPFFTTKPSGSGIGLSVSRYIMRLHGGKLHHFVSPGGMTVFQLEMEQGK